MTERVLPGIGLTGFWDQGAPWKVGGDQNWLLSSVLTQLGVVSATTSLPASPLNGVIYIVPVGDPNANQVAARDNGAWVYFPPQEGWTAYVRDTGVLMNFDGTDWVPSTTPLATALAASGGAGLVGNDSDPGYSELMTAAEALSLRFHVWNYLTAAERTDAETGSPAIDTSVKIQKAIDRAALFGRPLDGCGTFRVGAQKIVFKSDSDFSDATFLVYGAPAIALEVSTGSAADPTDRLESVVVRLPKRTVNMTKPATGWAGQGIGVRCVNLDSCIVYTGNIVDFAINLQTNAFSTGNAYNAYHVQHLENGQVNLDTAVGSGGWNNENTYYDGRYSHLSAEGANVAGVRHIRMLPATSAQNNNLFVKPSIEGDVSEYHVECAGSYNTFLQARWESTPPKILYTGTNSAHGNRNRILGGYGVQNVVVSTSGTIGGANSLIGPGVQREEMVEGRRVSNRGSSTNPIDIFYDAGTSPDTAGAADWSAQQSARWLKGKAKADTFERVRIEYSTSRIYFGNGTADPTVYIGAAGAAGYGASADWGPITTGTTDLGTSGRVWRDLFVGSIRPGANTVRWTSGAGTPEGVLVAGIGSLYTRTDGGAGTTLYIKESGTGSTGWVAK